MGVFRSGSDEHIIWKDHKFGHESEAEVIAIGRDVTGLEVGDHVFPNRRTATAGGFSAYLHIPKCEAS